MIRLAYSEPSLRSERSHPPFFPIGVWSVLGVISFLRDPDLTVKIVALRNFRRKIGIVVESFDHFTDSEQRAKAKFENTITATHFITHISHKTTYRRNRTVERDIQVFLLIKYLLRERTEDEGASDIRGSGSAVLDWSAERRQRLRCGCGAVLQAVQRFCERERGCL